MKPPDLGEFIREQRRVGQLSLRKLSELSGISNPYLSQIERGLRRPSAEILQQIARALSISAETLYDPGRHPRAADRRPATWWPRSAATPTSTRSRSGPWSASTSRSGPTTSASATVVTPRRNPPPRPGVRARRAFSGRPVAAHLAPGPTGRRRQRRHERLRAGAGVGPGPGRRALRRLRAPLARRPARGRSRSSRASGWSTCRPGPADLVKEKLPEVVDEYTEWVGRPPAGERRHRRHPRQLLAVGPGRPPAQARALAAAGVDVPHAGPGQGRDRRPRARPAGRGRDRGHRLLRRHPGLVSGRGRTSSSSSTAPTRAHRDRAARRRPRLLLARRPAWRPPGPRRLGDQPVLLFVGRIQPLKGVDVAVRALAELSRRPPRRLLVIVGGASGLDGPAEQARVRRLVDELGLADRVRFVAPQPHHLLSTYYRAADVCIVPSRSESFGLVALEAAACGTPVVAADVGGLSTLVDDGRPASWSTAATRPTTRRRWPGSSTRPPWPPRCPSPPSPGPGATPGPPPRPACAGSTPTSPPGPWSSAREPTRVLVSRGGCP